MGIKDYVKRALYGKQNKSYRQRLRRFLISYPQWAAEWEESDRFQGSCRTVSGKGTGFSLILSAEGILADGAAEKIADYFLRNPEKHLLYGDEDVWPGGEKGRACSPWFKPDWSPDLLESRLYFGSLAAVRDGLFRRTSERYAQKPESGLPFEQTEEGIYRVRDQEAYWEWLHLCAELAGGYEKGDTAIGHIASLLSHCTDGEQQAAFLDPAPCLKQYLTKQREQFYREMERYRSRSAETEPEGPAISVVIPSKDQPEVLENCLRSCLTAGEQMAHEEGAAAPKEPLTLEMLVVDNGSSSENRKRTEALLRKLDRPGFRLRYLYQPMEFHFSKMCNLGADQARGRFLLFLNDDVEFCEAGCMEEMAVLAGRSFTGAVGMKLRYPDSSRIQHAGIVNLPMGPVHKLQFLDDNKCYYYGANRGRRNVLAVTGACLMVERRKFTEAGGFPEELRVAFNDVSLCFRLHELGYRNVCLNDRYAYHHESFSRGTDESPEKLKRLLAERDALYRLHPQLEGTDPYYSVYLNREGLDTGIRPAWMTVGNRTQHRTGRAGTFNAAACRRDECLMVRIEDCRGGEITGYNIVLGDDNACYEKSLILWRQKTKGTGRPKGPDPTAEDEVYEIKLGEQYRPDLEENLPDQKNVALSGFHVKLEAGVLPDGLYRVGAAARNRVTGLKLVNWSSRYLKTGDESV